MICPDCGKQLSPSDRNCPHCAYFGKPPPAPPGTLRCVTCGNPLSAGDTCCSRCGLQFPIPAPPLAGAPAHSAAEVVTLEIGRAAGLSFSIQIRPDGVSRLCVVASSREPQSATVVSMNERDLAQLSSVVQQMNSAVAQLKAQGRIRSIP